MSNLDNEKLDNSQPNRQGALDDERRVKVLSPSMMVFKRFVRNKLAIVGFVILVVMFVFSFLGDYLFPYHYGQAEVFYKYEYIFKDYASATRNKELRYTVNEGSDFPQSARAQMMRAITKNADSFSANGISYSLVREGEDFYRVESLETLGNAMSLKGKYAYSGGAESLSDGLKTAFQAANDAGESSFEYEGEAYAIVKAGKSLSISRSSNVALASMLIYDAYEPDVVALVDSFNFRYLCETAINAGAPSFSVNGAVYSIEMEEDAGTIYDAENMPVAGVSRMIVNPVSNDIFLSVPFKTRVAAAIDNDENAFTFEDVDYTVQLVHETFTIQAEAETLLIDMYARPSAEHLLGTDQNGMDVLTRLMYGGRVSLLVGFVVVIIEILLGVSIGGISGYFGGWIDMVLMRLVDLVDCIPYWPMMIIIGSVMDTLEVPPQSRIFLLMLIMGLLGWSGMARVVRGQILALREQDFMVATEATGIRVSRRIFRHLVPNVIPLLIVQATMGLGNIIISEATLSFLGLGVKYPLASWGTIINSATNLFVMTNYWFMWIPAGFLILLTVLGFNFVGDGLRDAFDPRMKR